MATVGSINVKASVKEEWWVYPVLIVATIVSYVPFCKGIAKKLSMLCITLTVDHG